MAINFDKASVNLPVSGFFSLGHDLLQCGQLHRSISLKWHWPEDDDGLGGVESALRTFT